MNRIALGERIRQERLHMNLTQEQLAEAVGVSSTYIGFIEHGARTVTLEKLIVIANTLYVSVDYLLTDSLESSADTEFAILKKLWMQASASQQALFIDIAKSILHHSDI